MKNLDFKLSFRRRLDENGEPVQPSFARCYKGNASTQSNPTTTTQINDSRVAASEGSVSTGAGGSTVIQSQDASIVKAAGDTITTLAEHANDAALGAISGNVEVSRSALTANNNVSETAIGGNVAVTRSALDFGESIAQSAINAASNSQQSANDLIQRTNDSFTNKLAANAGPAATTIADNTIKYIAIGAAVIAAAIIFKPSNK